MELLLYFLPQRHQLPGRICHASVVRSSNSGIMTILPATKVLLLCLEETMSNEWRFAQSTKLYMTKRQPVVMMS